MPSSPNTIFAGTAGPHGDRPGPDRALSRIFFYLLFFVVCPVGAIVHFCWMYAFNYARMRWWLPAATFMVLLLGGAATGNLNPVTTVTAYVDPWREAFQSDSPLDWLFSNLGNIVVSQLWVGLLVGTGYAGVSAAWKWYRRPVWQERQIKPGMYLKWRKNRNVKEVEEGRNRPPHSDGITVGVAADTRDGRFAAGYPGEKYGNVVYQTDAEGAQHTLVTGGSGSGKALDVDTPIPTPDRGMVPIGDLVTGDLVYGSAGTPVKVVAAYLPMRDHECFEVLFSDGATIVADSDHLWTVHPGVGTNRVTVETRRLVDYGLKGVRCFLPQTGPVPVRDHRRQVWVVSVIPVVSRPVRCIAVDATDRLFLAGESWLPTHNTTTMLIGMRDVIRVGRGLVVLDCKGGPDIPEQIADWAARYGRPFHHWLIQNPQEPYVGPADHPAYYDPISRGDPSRRKDLLIGSQRWDVEYYKTEIGNYLQTLFAVMDLVPAPAGIDTFTDVADLLSPTLLLRRAENRIDALAHPDLAAALSRLPEMGDTAMSGIRNMYSRFHTLVASSAGRWLRKDPNGLYDINLRDVADNGEVVVFSLDSSNYKETASLIAGLIIQDLITVSSELRHNAAPTPTHVYVDEFSAIDTVNMISLLNKARDSRMPVTLSTQTLADLDRLEPTFSRQVSGVISSFLVHRANTEEEATFYAGLSGVRRKTMERTGAEQTSSMFGSLGAAANVGAVWLEEKDDYAIPPGKFQELKRGTCIYITMSPQMRYIHPVEVVRELPHAALAAHQAQVAKNPGWQRPNDFDVSPQVAEPVAELAPEPVAAPVAEPVAEPKPVAEPQITVGDLDAPSRLAGGGSQGVPLAGSSVPNVNAPTRPGGPARSGPSRPGQSRASGRKGGDAGPFWDNPHIP